MSLAILDLDYGNVESVRLGFSRLGVEADLVRDPHSVSNAERLVVPGVGNAGYAMRRLEEARLVAPLKKRQGPTLGICVGMQLLFEASEECERPLLGLLPGKVRALEPAANRPVPHMGWSRIDSCADGFGLSDGDYLYFAHSYACPDVEGTAATTRYGRTVPAAVRSANLWGAQFHPERSSRPGAAFLEAFLSS